MTTSHVVPITIHIVLRFLSHHNYHYRRPRSWSSERHYWEETHNWATKKEFASSTLLLPLPPLLLLCSIHAYVYGLTELSSCARVFILLPRPKLYYYMYYHCYGRG